MEQGRLCARTHQAGGWYAALEDNHGGDRRHLKPLSSQRVCVHVKLRHGPSALGFPFTVAAAPGPSVIIGCRMTATEIGAVDNCTLLGYSARGLIDCPGRIVDWRVE